jgi:hypothetical protein
MQHLSASVVCSWPDSPFYRRFGFGFGFFWHGFTLAVLTEQGSYDLQTFEFVLYLRLLQFFFPQDLVYIFQRIYPSFVLAMTLQCATWAASGTCAWIRTSASPSNLNSSGRRQCLAQGCSNAISPFCILEFLKSIKIERTVMLRTFVSPIEIVPTLMSLRNGNELLTLAVDGCSRCW